MCEDSLWTEEKICFMSVREERERTLVFMRLCVDEGRNLEGLEMGSKVGRYGWEQAVPAHLVSQQAWPNLSHTKVVR